MAERVERRSSARRDQTVPGASDVGQRQQSHSDRQSGPRSGSAADEFRRFRRELQPRDDGVLARQGDAASARSAPNGTMSSSSTRTSARSRSNIARRARRSISRANCRRANITDKDGNQRKTTEVVLQRFRGELTLLDSRGRGRLRRGSRRLADSEARVSDAPRRWSATSDAARRAPRPAARRHHRRRHSVLRQRRVRASPAAF